MARVENINLTRVSANVGNRNARVDGCVLRSFWKRCCPNVVTIATGLKPVFLILRSDLHSFPILSVVFPEINP